MCGRGHRQEVKNEAKKDKFDGVTGLIRTGKGT